MTDNQLQVHLGETTPDGRARAAALQAASGAGWQPVQLIPSNSTFPRRASALSSPFTRWGLGAGVSDFR